MTEDKLARLEEIEKRMGAATPGPWISSDYYIFQKTDLKKDEPLYLGQAYGRTGDEFYANGAFIAEARQDIPWLIESLRDAWADKVRIIANADERWITYQHDLKSLREELAEYRNVLGWYANKGHPNSEWDKSLWWQHAEKVLAKWDRTTKE